MKTVDDFKEWDPVTYVPNHAHGNASHEDCEHGFVSSKNDTVVFVRFSGCTSQACDPENLVSG